MATAPKRKAKRGTAPGRGAKAGEQGQARFVATSAQRQAVMALVAAGTEQRIISLAMNIPLRTLVRHFRQELDDGLALVLAQVGGSVSAKALRGERPYDMFLLKTKGGWRDHQRIGFEDEKGQPVSPANLFQVSIT